MKKKTQGLGEVHPHVTTFFGSEKIQKQRADADYANISHMVRLHLHCSSHMVGFASVYKRR